MSGMSLPINTVTVTATIEVSVNEITKVYSTSLLASTHKLTEIDYLIDRAWDATRKESAGEENQCTSPPASDTQP